MKYTSLLQIKIGVREFDPQEIGTLWKLEFSPSKTFMPFTNDFLINMLIPQKIRFDLGSCIL